MPGVDIIYGNDVAIKDVHMRFADLKIPGRRFGSKGGVSGCMTQLIGSSPWGGVLGRWHIMGAYLVPKTHILRDVILHCCDQSGKCRGWPSYSTIVKRTCSKRSSV